MKKPYLILVGVDFSELSDLALAEALKLAGARADSELHAVALLAAPALDSRYAVPAYSVLDEVGSLANTTERLRAHLELQLQGFALKYPGIALPARILSHVSFDSPAHGIAQLASDLEADLIVVGTHNRRGLERLLLGSVAEATVRYARCPVLVIPFPAPHEELKLEPPCPECVRARSESAGKQLWCAQHLERHGRRHTYHQADRSGVESNFPLVNR
ncbi:MAG TPA: universal stress protein [Polyangiaceae bacterium]|jgi:nucleotide-binding universal stress UspA family protein